MAIPFLLFGDGPLLHSGLARIARDLAVRLFNEQEDLGIRFQQCGISEPTGWHFQAWEFYGFQPSTKDYGRSAVAEIVALGGRPDDHGPPIIFSINDAGRLYDLTRTKHEDDALDVEIDTERIWAYIPVDGHNVSGAFGGPAAVAVQTCERLLGYGRYGAEVLKRTRAQADAQEPVKERVSIPYLPHGIEPHVFCPRALEEADPGFQQWYARLEAGQPIIGCVATNQPRKDLGLLFSTVGQLRAMGHPVALWLQTDLMTHAWDIGELAVQFRLPKRDVFVSTLGISDAMLAARYAASHVTIAPGLGEGFGYPIVESLSCGTPVVHGNYAGGVELIPDPAWLVQPAAWRLESIYALQRPVFQPSAVAGRVVHILEQRAESPDQMREYCRGSVAHLSWEHLWPRWRSWIAKGLR